MNRSSLSNGGNSQSDIMNLLNSSSSVRNQLQQNRQQYSQLQSKFFISSQSQPNLQSIDRRLGYASNSNQQQDFILKEMMKKPVRQQEYEDDKQSLMILIAQQQARGNFQNSNNLKRLLGERNLVNSREKEYFNYLQTYLNDMKQRPEIIDSIERTGRMNKLKITKERIQADRLKILSAMAALSSNFPIPGNNPLTTSSLSNSIVRGPGGRLLTGSYNDIRNSQDEIGNNQAQIDRYKTFLMPNNNTSFNNYNSILDQSTRNATTFVAPSVNLSTNDLQKMWNINDRSQILDTTGIGASFMSSMPLNMTGNKNNSAQNAQMQMDAEHMINTFQQSTNLANEMTYTLSGLDPALAQLGEKNQFFKMGFPDKSEDNQFKQMSEEETQLVKLVTTEADIHRLLSRIPKNSPEYAQRERQVNEITRRRKDLEKIVQEQKYQRVRQDYEKTNPDNEDRQRGKQTRDHLLAGIASLHNVRRYQSWEGFVVYWDFTLNLPKKYEMTQITFGLFQKGETIITPQSLEDKVTTTQSFSHNMCLYSDRDHIYDIRANQDILLVIQMQCFSKDIMGRPQMEVYGWTLLELFDMSLDLMRGKWKIPFYSTKINPNILVSQIKQLKAQSNTMLYLRIAFPQDHEFGWQEPINPLVQTAEFFVPIIHQQTIIEAAAEYENLKKGEDMFNLKILPDEPPEEEKKQEKIEGDGKLDDFLIQNGDDDEVQSDPGIQWKEWPYSDNRRGLHITVHNLLKMIDSKNRTQVKVQVVDIQRGIIIDDFEIDCEWNTDLYENAQTLKKQKLKGTDFMNTEESEMVQDGLYIYDEDNHFFVDIDTFAHNNRAHDDIYILFMVYIEKYAHEPDEEEQANEQQKNELAALGDLAATERDAMQKLQEEKFEQKQKNVLLGKTWFAFPLYKWKDPNNIKKGEEKIMKTGRYFERTFPLPLKSPPFDELQYSKLDSEIDFSLNYFDYDIDNMQRLKEKFDELNALQRKMRRQGKPKKKKEVKVVQKKKVWSDFDDEGEQPFIENIKRQFHDRPFEKGFGIDFYIDQLRFLPDNVTVCKISVSIINRNFESLFDQEAALPNLKTQAYKPRFLFRLELRAPHFDPTMHAFLIIQTVDQQNREVRIVGYSIINFFLNRGTKKVTEDQLDSNVMLMNGNYQLPIFCQHPPRIKPFNVHSLEQMDRLPCSSILVRIKMAAMSDDGLRALSMHDVAQKQWETQGIWQPAPAYMDLIGGYPAYNTMYCNLRDSEKELFSVRAAREDPGQIELLNKLISYDNQSTAQLTEASALSYVDQKINLTPYTDIIELSYFAQYKPSAGFQFSLDGFHNVPITDRPVVGVYCLNPPADLYRNLGAKTNTVILNSHYDFNSPVISPRFNEGFFTFKEIPFEKNLHVIIDVKGVKFSEKKTKSVLENLGWTICPVFTPNGYIKSGIYQLPIFKGAVPLYMIDQMAHNDPWELLIEQTKLKQNPIRYYENMSCIVRLLDAQREGHYQTLFDHTRITYSYLPQDKLGSYAFNAAVEVRLQQAQTLMKFVDNKAQVLQYNELVTKSVIQNLDLK